MKILLVGSGGREHALAWKIAQSPRVTHLFVAPGNAGTAATPLAGGDEAINIAIAADDVDGLVTFAVDAAIDLVVVGPEAPLAAGLADQLRAKGIATFGPDAAAARLESSKAFSKEFMRSHDVPTAGYGVFDNQREAKRSLTGFEPPYVIKADGLAAGKGVVIAQTREDAEAAIDEMLLGRFGDASSTIVIEEFMTGEEASFFALVDGETAIPFAAAQDHKRAYDGDMGPNTGGMGAYSPTPALTAEQAEEVMATSVRPTVEGMAQRGAPYRGVLFVGLMMTEDGPKVVEYNVRFGDPECQVLMVRMKSDIVPYLDAAAKGALADAPPIAWDPAFALTVVMAAKGYPGAVEKGSRIDGIEAANALPGVTVFHAGTTLKDGAVTANGGRVLNVTASGATIDEAIARAYAGVDAIDWPEGFCRRDIAFRARWRR
jgi:phosphoribosylamine--glycine ligase